MTLSDIFYRNIEADGQATRERIVELASNERATTGVDLIAFLGLATYVGSKGSYLDVVESIPLQQRRW